MKCPTKIYWYPLDVKKDEDGGLWFRLPQWIVRGFKLKDYGTNMGKVEMTIRKETRCMNDYHYKTKRGSDYFKENWSKKLNREAKKERLTQSRKRENK